MSTPRLVNLKHAMRYPDAAKRKIAHDQAIRKQDMERVADWNQTAPKGENKLPITISYS